MERTVNKMSGAEVVWQLNKKYISNRSTFTSTCQLTSLCQIGIMAYCMYLTWFKKENKVQMKYMRKRQKKHASRYRAHGHDNVYTSSRAQNRVFLVCFYFCSRVGVGIKEADPNDERRRGAVLCPAHGLPAPARSRIAGDEVRVSGCLAVRAWGCARPCGGLRLRRRSTLNRSTDRGFLRGPVMRMSELV